MIPVIGSASVEISESPAESIASDSIVTAVRMIENARIINNNDMGKNSCFFCENINKPPSKEAWREWFNDAFPEYYRLNSITSIERCFSHL